MCSFDCVNTHQNTVWTFIIKIYCVCWWPIHSSIQNYKANLQGAECVAGKGNINAYRILVGKALVK